MHKKFFVLLIGIFMIGSVLALGVTPARTTLDFEPGLVREVEFSIVNSGEQDINLRLSVRGDLAEYIQLSATEISLSATESSKKLKYTISLPSELVPGLNTADIVIAEVSGGDVSAGSYVKAMVAVVTQVHVYVPYPGKYIEAKMYIYGSDAEEGIRFVIPIVSAGEQDINSVRADVSIYDKGGVKIDSFSTGSEGVVGGAKKELVYDWISEAPIGEYVAKAEIVYDGSVLNLEEIFLVGLKELELLEIQIDSFSLGEIVRLDMLVENKWSEDITGAYIDASIKDSSGNIVSTFESAVHDVAGLSNGTFTSFWDTEGVSTGDYDAEVSLHYAGKTSSKDLTFEVSDNELVIIGLGFVISSETPAGTNTLVVVLVVVIVLLVLINLLWFFIFRKKMKGRKK
jgi:hypothetical protein